MSSTDYQKAGDGNAENEPEKIEGTPHPSVGINAKRGCTDCLGFLLLLIAIGLIVATANTAFSIGKPMRLLLGTDYMGNICGEDPAPANLTVNDWPRRNLLWYPLTFDYETKKLLTTEALKLGVCVSSCPPPGTLVKPYGANGNTPPPPWLVLFNSTPTFHRCMPALFTFDCQGNPDCSGFIRASNSTFAAAAALGNFANQALDEIRTYFWTIYVGIAIAIVLCFLWMLLLRRILTTFVKLSLLLVFLLLVGLGIMFMQLRQAKLDEDPNGESSAADWFLAGMIICFGGAFGFLIVLYFIWRDIIIACDIIEESTRVPVDIPSLVGLPPAALIAALLFASFAVVLAVFIQSCGEDLTFTLPVPKFLNASNPSTSNLISKDASLATINFNDTFTAKEIHFPNWRPWAHVWNLFFFLWMFGLMNAVVFMCISLCTVFWYFSNPGDVKTPPFGAVLTAFKYTIRYHIGTLAFGSMIVAIVQTVRVVLAIMEQQMQEANKLNDATKIMFKLAQCCLGYLEWVIKFINKNAYIVCSIEGSSFFPSARKALELIGHNAMSVGALTIISEYVILFGKLIVTCGALISSYFIIQAAGAASGISGGVILLLIIGVLSYFISCLFANVFSVCIDTMLICYCWDRDNREIDYFPADLAKHVEEMASHKRGSVDPGPKSGDGKNAEAGKEMLQVPNLDL